VGIRWGLRWKIHTVPRDPVGTSLENIYRSKGSGGDFTGKYVPFQGVASMVLRSCIGHVTHVTRCNVGPVARALPTRISSITSSVASFLLL